MDVNVERECSALGGLFNQIIADMKNGTPLWEDLISKATKLHACLRAAILAVSAYLEAFQKIADAATNARGATKEIGTALTRICLRHKAVETRMKSFTCAIMDRLVMPLQEKLEDWKKSLINLDKEHAKEYKKAKSELKKRSTDTLRLQKKKARKGIVQSHGQTTAAPQSQGNRIEDVELNRLLESSEASVHEKRLSLEETERRAVRAALLEERGRFCQLAKYLKPVLDEEIAMLMELTHLQEVSDQLERHAASPYDLPAASEQVISDLKGREMTQWALATPPSSPSLSLGSRKSSMCSISSLNSSSSGSCKNHPNSCTHPWHRSMSQPIGTRPSSIAGIGTTALRHLSRDSGFTSQDTLYRQPISEHQVSNVSSPSNQANCPTKSSTNATWPDLQETSVIERQSQGSTTVNERPHTISSAYEKGHQRPALSVYTFQAPDPGCCHSQPASPVSSPSSNPQLARVQMRKNSAGNLRPPIPSRCSSLERPAAGVAKNEGTGGNRGKAKLPMPAHLTKDLGNHQQQPMYVNMHELASLAANRAQEMQIPAAAGSATASGIASGGQASSSNTNEKTENPSAPEKDVGSATSESSLESSSGYGSQSTLPTFQSVPIQNETIVVASGSCTMPRRGSMQQPKPLPPTRRTSAIITSNYSSTTGSTGGLLTTTVVTDEQRTETTLLTDDTENLPPPPAFLLEGNSPTASPLPQRSISVSETVRTLTELRHTPASPSFLRKATTTTTTNPSASQGQGSLNQLSRCTTFVERSNSTRRVSTTSIESSTSSSSSLTQHQGPTSVSQGFMAVLSSKLMNTSSNVNSSGSPKSSRKHINVETTSLSPRTPVGFLETLNAKLAAQQQQVQQSQLLQNPPQIQHPPPQIIQTQQVRSNTTNRSASVRRIMANRVPIIDPLQVRGSLMDQIRRGTSLRKTSGPINDRSAPQIY